MNSKFKEKFNNYLKTRGIFFFIIFIAINLIAYLNIINLFVDIFSHFRLQYLFISTVFFVIFIYLSFQNRKFIITALIALLLIGINIVGIRNYIGNKITSEPIQTVKLGLFNVLTSNTNYSKFLEQINKNTPDILILQEVNHNWLNGIEELKTIYPHTIEHPRDDNFGIALYSKKSLKKYEIEYWTEAEVPIIHAITDDGIEIFGIHTLPPIDKKYFSIRNSMLKKISHLSNREKIIICGDFNTTIYSPAYKKFISKSRLNDAQICAKNIQGTWNTRYFAIFRIPLEHILYSNNFKLKSFSIGQNFGSDHLPIFAEIGW